MQLTLTAFENFPEVELSSPLADIILRSGELNGWQWEDGDILVLAQKIVSKSENRLFNLNDIEFGDEALRYAALTGKDPALIELILSESKNVLRTRKGLVIVEHNHGFICANAGIDQSNVKGVEGKEGRWVLLLPENPDKSAATIRNDIESQTGKRIAVIIIDSHGRSWRKGVVGVAIGVSGLSPLLDRRGYKDRFGYELKVTEIGTADELASAASILMGQADEGRPVVVVRGYPYPLTDGSISEIIRNEKDDLFR
jgi:coenzyme F420-0:L-glutamate ligase/coenzyme F420-1:gamma-L-glutamate ligase